jgi:acyl-CoA synthetase (AMP-forming)/AMP-acid ligase II
MASARHLFIDTALHDGPRLAVVTDRARASYRDLDLRSGRLAGALMERGLRPGERVAVLMGDSLEAVIAICAGLKAGAVLVPLDTRASAADVAAVLDDCLATALITDSRRAGSAAAAILSSPTVRVVVLAGGDQRPQSSSCLAFEDAISRAPRSPLRPPAAVDGPLLMVYPRTANGLTAPVTMTEADVLPVARFAPVAGAVVDAVRPMVSGRGVRALIGALAAGSTVVVSAQASPPAFRAVAA